MENNNTSERKVVSNSLIYTLSGLLRKCSSFLLMPLYTKWLTDVEYGITGIANSFITTMSFIVSFSLFSAITRFYVDYKNDEKKLKEFYGTVVLFTLLSGLGFAGLLCLGRGLLEKYVFTDVPFFPIILITIVTLIFHCLHTIYGFILRSQQRAVMSSVTSLAYFALNLGLNALLIGWLKLGAAGFLLANLLASIAYTVFFLWDMIAHGQITFCIRGGILKEALRYSIPIMPHNLSTNIVSLVSKILIGSTDSMSGLGLYNLAAQFGGVTDTAQTYVNYAFGPWLFEKLHAKQADYQRSIRSTANLICAVIGLLFLGIGLFSQDYILLFAGDGFEGAWVYIPWIVLTYAIKMPYYFYVSVLLYYKKASRWLFIATLSGSLINMLLSALLIPAYGAYGSIFADILAMVIRVAIIMVISRFVSDIGLRFRDFACHLLMQVVFLAAGYLPSYLIFKENRFSAVNFAYKLLIVAIYAGILFWLYRRQLVQYWNSFRRKRARHETKE